jgi:PEP-CTERM motif
LAGKWSPFEIGSEIEIWNKPLGFERLKIMSSKRLLFAMMFVLAVTSFSSAAVITNVSSSIYLQMSGDAGCGGFTTNGTDSQVGTLKNLKVVLDQKGSCPTHPSSFVEVMGKAVAKWNNAASGSVDFTNLGWNTKNVTGGYAFDNQGLDFSYTFMTKNKPVYFDVAYDIFGNGVNGDFGLNGFTVSLLGPSTYLPVDGTPGTLTWLLAPNTTYTLTITNLANIAGNLGTITNETMTGNFDFLAYPTPEPASLLLLGSGILGLAGVIRRKRS